MANITPNLKDGKVISYKFRCYLGREENGKQIFRCTRVSKIKCACALAQYDISV